MQKKRYGSLASLLCLLAPGAGFLYAGWWKLALLTPVLLFASITFIGGTRFILSPWGLLSIFLILLLSYLLSIIIAFFLARRSNSARENKGQHWFSYLLFIVVSALIALQLLEYRGSFLGYSAYLLPSSSMATTLLFRDYIMVDSWIYQRSKPQRGDIVIFKYPPKPNILFIKRVVAIEGDKVTLKKGRLMLNGQAQTEPYVVASNNVKTTEMGYQEWIVPKNHYFVLGDNRDNSNDSRYWGLLEREAIQGKASSIWFSYSTKGGFRFRSERLAYLY